MRNPVHSRLSNQDVKIEQKCRKSLINKLFCYFSYIRFLKSFLLNEIERKFCENEVENFDENPSKFAKILNKNKRISFNENFGGNPTFN